MTAIIVSVSYRQGDNGACFQRSSACGCSWERILFNPMVPDTKPMIPEMIAGLTTQFNSCFLYKVDEPVVFRNGIQFGIVQFFRVDPK